MSQGGSNTLIAPRFLFRFAVPLGRCDAAWKPGGLELDESFRLLDLAALDAGTDNQERSFADVRMAWNTHGLLLNVRVEGKQQPLWCRESRLGDSDGLHVWIDTRRTPKIHRARP